MPQETGKQNYAIFTGKAGARAQRLYTFLIVMEVLLIGASFFVFTNNALAAGIVPCGLGDKPDCDVCHLYQGIRNVMNFLLRDIGLPVLVIALLAGGIIWLTSGGSLNKITQGKSIILYAILGLFLAFAAWVIVNTILDTLGFKLPGPTPRAWNDTSICEEFNALSTVPAGPKGTAPPPTTTQPPTTTTALQCSASKLSTEAQVMITCIMAEAQKKGVPVITPSNNQKNGGGHTCNLTAPKISCHYGGTKCNGEGNAVDFALRADVPKTPANWSKLQSAASSCGAQGAGSSYCEISYAPYRTELGCSDPGINHLHVNTSKSCGCD